ncbi:MAG: MEMO1 family protein [Candidatus Omnitrophica bacterium]|nr:MEMO1 family protein [Candidatus Omnitrophota bacterium]
MTRKAQVAGLFYPAKKEALTKALEHLVSKAGGKVDAMGVISPHAGYIYSGRTAGRVFSAIKPKTCYVILGPNHTGLGKAFGLDMQEAWETPLGEAKIDRELGEAILKNSGYIYEDSECHKKEHSIEVQLPFLQYLNRDFKFVPIAVSEADAETYGKIGAEIVKSIREVGRNATIIASSDMTHYEMHDLAKQKDKLAIDRILDFDVNGLLRTIYQHNITMCGFVPAAIMMKACIEMGAKKSNLIEYTTSAEASGDYSAVVGYAGIVLS